MKRFQISNENLFAPCLFLQIVKFSKVFEEDNIE